MEHNHEIAKIAYELYLTRNGAPGDPVSDWITAERIYVERQMQEPTVLAEETPAPVEGLVKARARKVATKAAASEKAVTKTTKKTEAKASAPKTEKASEAPKAKKTTRKKTTGNPVQ